MKDFNVQAKLADIPTPITITTLKLFCAMVEIVLVKVMSLHSEKHLYFTVMTED